MRQQELPCTVHPLHACRHLVKPQLSWNLGRRGDKVLGAFALWKNQEVEPVPHWWKTAISAQSSRVRPSIGLYCEHYHFSSLSAPKISNICFLSAFSRTNTTSVLLRNVARMSFFLFFSLKYPILNWTLASHSFPVETFPCFPLPHYFLTSVLSQSHPCLAQGYITVEDYL